METNIKKGAVDLTDLAIGIVVLGIVVTIGATILINMRDNTLTDLPVVTTNNETVTPSATATLTNTWGQSVGTVYNATTGLIASGNYTTSISPSTGVITLSNATQACSICSGTWKVTYDWYNTSQADWALANNAANGLGEYGNWFDIIVIVGVATLVLSIIFMAFGGRGGSSSNAGSY